MIEPTKGQDIYVGQLTETMIEHIKVSDTGEMSYVGVIECPNKPGYLGFLWAKLLLLFLDIQVFYAISLNQVLLLFDTLLDEAHQRCIFSLIYDVGFPSGNSIVPLTLSVTVALLQVSLPSKVKLFFYHSCCWLRRQKMPSSSKLFTCGFGDQILIYDAVWSPELKVSFHRAIAMKNVNANYGLYSEKHQSLYTVHMPLNDVDNKANGKVSRWQVDLNSDLILVQKEVLSLSLDKHSQPLEMPDRFSIPKVLNLATLRLILSTDCCWSPTTFPERLPCSRSMSKRVKSWENWTFLSTAKAALCLPTDFRTTPMLMQL